MCMLLVCKTWIHGVFRAQGIHSDDCSACKVAVLKWGGLSLWSPGAQRCISGVGVKRGWRGLCILCLWRSSCCLWSQLKRSHQRALTVLPFRSTLFAFGKAQKAPKGTYFQSIPRERYNHSSVFSSLLDSVSIPQKQTDRLTDKLPAFSIWQSLISLPNGSDFFHRWPCRGGGILVISNE